jgi:hypothetical protein
VISGIDGDDRLTALRKNYRTAFLRYLPGRAEPALTVAYKLGRDALTSDISVLDLVRVHHEVLAETIAATSTDEVADVIDAAADFLAEALGTTDMAQRALQAPDQGS